MPNYPETPLWTDEESAEFILNNSLNEAEYRRNHADVIEMGVDPLAVNSGHLLQENAWARPDCHPDILLARRTS